MRIGSFLTKGWITILLAGSLFYEKDTLASPFAPIVIITDGALDDLRAITLFYIHQKECPIYGWVASSGILSAQETAEKLSQFLSFFGSNTPFIGIGKESHYHHFAYAMNKSIPWEGEKSASAISTLKTKEASLYLHSIFDTTSTALTLIVLSPLSDVATWLQQHPGDKKNIREILWYAQWPLQKSTNYLLDSVAAQYIFQSTIPIHLIHNQENKKLTITFSWLDSLQKKQTKATHFIYTVHQNPDVQKKIQQHHLKIWDDLVPIYYFYPEYFTFQPQKTNPRILSLVSFNPSIFPQIYFDLLEKPVIPPEERMGIFLSFPDNPAYFHYDLRNLKDSIIQKYGKREWEYCLLTHEVHGHFGMYSMIGVKMALFALEYFHIENRPYFRPRKNLKIISFAGEKPPLSCLTDGLQITTGATLGQGLITLASTKFPSPEAIFICNSDTLHLKLKPQYEETCQKEIQQLLFQYGISSDAYWHELRKLSLHYWLAWDRKKMFNIIH